MAVKVNNQLTMRVSIRDIVMQGSEWGSLKCTSTQPSECGREHTLNIVPAQTAAQQQSNESYEARMSGKCGEWRD